MRLTIHATAGCCLWTVLLTLALLLVLDGTLAERLTQRHPQTNIIAFHEPHRMDWSGGCHYITSTPSPSSSITHSACQRGWTKQRKTVPFGWSIDPSTSVPQDTLVHLHITLQWQNMDLLEERFWNVSDPSHEDYARYLNRTELRELVHPSKATFQAIYSWLEVNTNVPRQRMKKSFLGDQISLVLPLHRVEELLHTKYMYYEHQVTGTRIIRTNSYSIPAAFKDMIAFVGPSIHMVDAVTMRNLDGEVATIDQAFQDYSDDGMRLGVSEQQLGDLVSDTPSCTPYVDLPCLNYLYNINNAYGVSSENSICATGYDQEYIAGSDIEQFLQQFDPQWVDSSVSVIGPNDQTNPGGEATMDVQLIMGIGSNVSAYFWSTGGSEPHGPSAAEPFLAFWTDLVNSEGVPLVVSTSYGDNEFDLDMDYLNAVNAKFQAAALRGVSILFASGDGGVAGGQAQNCTTFIAVFPSASPYVTAVGGTQLATSPIVESGASFSSGGFSNYWTQPSYQTDAVKYYLQHEGSQLPPRGLFNVTGRAFPDVSAMSNNLPTVIRGQAWPAGGTSCASPIFSGVIALLNDHRLQAGQGPLGFLNPWLYQSFATAPIGSFLNDIILGNNPGCNTAGFYAAVGWDPITGLGTPNYEAMLSTV